MDEHRLLPPDLQPPHLGDRDQRSRNVPAVEAYELPGRVGGRGGGAGPEGQAIALGLDGRMEKLAGTVQQQFAIGVDANVGCLEDDAMGVEPSPAAEGTSTRA